MFSQLKARFGSGLAVGILGIIAIWIIALVILPQLLMVDYSFRPNLLPADIGGPEDTYSLVNYETLFNNKIHLTIFFKTIWSSVLVASLTLLSCQGSNAAKGRFMLAPIDYSFLD